MGDGRPCVDHRRAGTLSVCGAWIAVAQVRRAPLTEQSLSSSRQFARVHFTERQMIPPSTQPEVVSASPDKDIVPE